MSDIEQTEEAIRAITEGIIADAEGSSKPDLILRNLKNAMEKLASLRSALP